MQLDKGMFIVSIDVDVGDKLLGVINQGKNDRYVNDHVSEYAIGQIEEAVFPFFLGLFDELEIPVTFALRGQLVTVNQSIFELLLNSPVGHDIGAHGYSHKQFGSMSRDEAEGELREITRGLKKLGILPKSFIFPRNSVAHLDLLEKYKFKCYRSYGDFRYDCMWVEKKGELYEIHPSFYLDLCFDSFLLRKIIDIAISKRLPFHVWSHLWNFGGARELAQKNVKRILPLFKYVKRMEKLGMLTVETMYSATNRVEKLVEY
jgi:peptidoglycan/xylan/chitin deacetylase (PgdA/CDA1 family)